MSLIVSEKGNNTKSNNKYLISEGEHNAVCFAIAAVGQQKTSFGNMQDKLYLGFEIDDNGTHKSLWQPYTLSLNSNSTLRSALTNWRDKGFTSEELKGFSLSKLLGVPCRITITNATGKNGRTYSNIGRHGVDIRKATEKMDSQFEQFIFDNDDPVKENFDKLPKYIQSMVNHDNQTTQEAPAPVDEQVNIDLPF